MRRVCLVLLLYWLEGMIEYYVELEEYERCIVLKKILNEKYPKTIVNNN